MIVEPALFTMAATGWEESRVNVKTILIIADVTERDPKYTGCLATSL